MALMFLKDAEIYKDYLHYCRHFHWHQPPTNPPQHILYHTYWHGKLTRHHELSLKSLLLTQSDPFEIWLWLSPEDMNLNRDFASYYQRYSQITFRPYVPEAEIVGTPYDKHIDVLRSARVCMTDGFRPLILGKYGGVYFDLD